MYSGVCLDNKHVAVSSAGVIHLTPPSTGTRVISAAYDVARLGVAFEDAAGRMAFGLCPWTRRIDMGTERTHRKASNAVARKRNPWALDGVAYDVKARKLVLQFPAGVSFLIPIDLVGEFAQVDAALLSQLYLTPSGETIALDEADVYISTRGLISDVFARLPPEISASHFGSRGGSKTSEAKRVASIENGRKGGRPSKSNASRPPEKEAA